MASVSNLKDRYGMTLSTSSPAAAHLWLEGADLLVSQNFGAEARFNEAISIDEGFALPYAGLGYLLMLQAKGDEAKAQAAHAEDLTKGITRRERSQVKAISLFVNGKGRDSTRLIHEHLAEYPRDALLMRLAQRLYMQGCSGAGVPNFPVDLLALLKSVEKACGDDWAFQGQYAFAHHENGLLDEAMTLARRSLEQYPTNAVAAHSVTHVFFEKGEPDEGGDFLGEWLKGFDRRASYRVHLSWHQALFQLALGRYGQAYDLYESDIRPSVVAKSAQSLADSASLMWRLQMYAGVPPSMPWQEVRDQATPAAERPGPAFRDAHAALAFAASGDSETLNKLAARLQEDANKGNLLSKEVTLPLVKGIDAFAQQDYVEAARLLEPLYPQFARIGGSHAQREVFEDTLLEAYLRAEQFDNALEMLQERLSRRESVRDTFWLARAEAGQGETETAQSLLHQASAGWHDGDTDSPEVRKISQLIA